MGEFPARSAKIGQPVTKPGPSTLDIAKATLLTPFGVDQVATDRVFGTILAHRADDADLFFQYNRSEGWSLEEGEVKSGSYSHRPGRGRARGGGREDRLRLCRRHHARGARVRRPGHPRHRRPGRPWQGGQRRGARRQRALCPDRPGGAVRRCREGAHPRGRRALRPRRRPAREAGDGPAVGRVRRGARGARRRRGRRGRASARCTSPSP